MVQETLAFSVYSLYTVFKMSFSKGIIIEGNGLKECSQDLMMKSYAGENAAAFHLFSKSPSFVYAFSGKIL